MGKWDFGRKLQNKGSPKPPTDAHFKGKESPLSYGSVPTPRLSPVESYLLGLPRLFELKQLEISNPAK